MRHATHPANHRLEYRHVRLELRIVLPGPGLRYLCYLPITDPSGGL